MDAVSAPIVKLNNIKDIRIGMNECITLEEEIKKATLDYKANEKDKKEESKVKDLTVDMLEDIINETNERPTMGETPKQTDITYTREEER